MWISSSERLHSSNPVPPNQCPTYSNEYSGVLLLALAGKVASELQFIIRERPVIYGGLLRSLSDESDEVLQYVIDCNEQGTLYRKE